MNQAILCSNCRAQIQQGNPTCPFCGANIVWASPIHQTAPQAVPQVAPPVPPIIVNLQPGQQIPQTQQLPIHPPPLQTPPQKPPRGVSRKDLRQCPYCKDWVPKDAVVCRSCSLSLPRDVSTFYVVAAIGIAFVILFVGLCKAVV